MKFHIQLSVISRMYEKLQNRLVNSEFLRHNSTLCLPRFVKANFKHWCILFLEKIDA